MNEDHDALHAGNNYHKFHILERETYNDDNDDYNDDGNDDDDDDDDDDDSDESDSYNLPANEHCKWIEKHCIPCLIIIIIIVVIR